MSLYWRVLVLYLTIIVSLTLFAQAPSGSPAPKFLSPTQRLTAAKTVFMNNLGGTDIPFNVIQAGVESWGKYILVGSAEKADLIVEVLSPDEEAESTTTKSKISSSGRPEESTTTTHDLSNGNIKLTVRDAHTKAALFAATEQPKGAFKTKTRQDNLVATAQSLLQKFHDRVDPPVVAPAPDANPK